MEIWHNLVAFKKIRHWCPLQKKNQLAMGYMIHVKFILFSCIPLSCFRGFHHCRVFWPPRRSNVCLVTKGRQPKRLEFTIKKYISSEIDINFQKNNVSFSWSAVLPKINKHYDTVVVFESFFFIWWVSNPAGCMLWRDDDTPCLDAPLRCGSFWQTVPLLLNIMTM